MSSRRPSFTRNTIPVVFTIILLMIIYVLMGMIELKPLMNEYLQPTMTYYTKNITSSAVNYYNEKINTIEFSSLFTTKHFMNTKNDDDDSYYTQWGEWSFHDKNDNIRPKDDYCSSYPHRDIPSNAFPKNAWQTDEVYMKDFLTEAKQLLHRAKEAIFTEYGLGSNNNHPSYPSSYSWSSQLTPSERHSHRHTLSNLTLLDFDNGVTPPRDRAPVNNAGWTTPKSYDGIVRRLLHAMMTGDNFTVVLAGHSSAAGHGNHFKQSYTMEFYRIMVPIFKRLGVTLITKNLAMGGLGTIQSSLGSQSIYGSNIDLLLWDSAMTEPSPALIDIFTRQALLSPSHRPPILFGGLPSHLHKLYTHTGADIGMFGDGTSFLPLTKNETQVEKDLPPLLRYLNCDAQHAGLCTNSANKYRTTCWIEREDVTPLSEMRYLSCPGQESWHPGWRFHRLRGRVLALIILSGLEHAVETWSGATSHPLKEEHWHVSEYYKAIQDKTRVLQWDPSEGYCESVGNGVILPKKVCTVPLFGMTEFTPRNDPTMTGIQGRLVKRLWKGEETPSVLERFRGMLYEGDDVPIPSLSLPEGVLDVERIVSQRKRRRGRRGLKPERRQLLDRTKDGDNNCRNDTIQEDYLTSQQRQLSSIPTSLYNTTIISGLGWDIDAMPGYCDGTYNAICGRRKDEICALCGHHDHRGGILGHSMSGWLIFNLPPLTEGIIILKIVGFVVITPRTNSWTKVNNGTDEVDGDDDARRRRRRLPTTVRGRKATRNDKLCPEVAFDYAINGNVTTLNNTQLFDKLKVVSRVVELMTILDDETFVTSMTEEEKKRDVEVAIRMRNCRTFNGLTLTHVYWA